jgi:hypothetical protein
MKQDIACPHCSAGSLLPSLRMTAADIKETMRDKLVLCIHRKLTPNVVPCASVQCSFKNNELRPSTACELHRCGKFVVTDIDARPWVKP